MNFYSLSALSLVAGRQEGITNCWCVGVGDLTGALHVLAIQVVTTAPSIISCWPRAGSVVVRIDPLRFLAGCRTRRLNQALSVLSLSLGFL